MADSPVKEGDILAGKYRVERVLGEGGMGVVVSAWHTELDQRVAMKFLLPELAERGDAAERFRREARAAVKIKSEHVARVLDVGTLEVGVPYMVMEFLEGHDLSEELVRRGTLEVEEAVEFVLQACEAIAEAHSVGIVHRDLKPANLFITQRADGSRIVKVLDFGISKTLGGGMDMSLTRTAAIIGSPLYMSPEQMDSAKDVDQRTDIWSLGVILYELLVGKPPFNGNSIPQLCAALLNETPTPVTHFRPDVSEDLSQAVLHCLEKSVDSRYLTVAELVSALGGFGPPGSIVSVERVQRVLGHSVVRSSSPGAGGPPLTGARTVASGPVEASGLISSPNLEVIAVPVPPRTSQPGVEAASQGGNTIANWGRTGAGSEAPKRGPLVWIGGAVAALLVGAGALWAVGTSTSAAAPEPASRTDSLSAQEAEKAAALKAVEEKAEAEEKAAAEAKAAQQKAAEEKAAEEKAAEEKAAEEKAAEEKAGEPKAAKPAQRPTSAKPASKPATKPAAKPTSGITDFGGRN